MGYKRITSQKQELGSSIYSVTRAVRVQSTLAASDFLGIDWLHPDLGSLTIKKCCFPKGNNKQGWQIADFHKIKILKR
jgi:hypothetical protein